MQTKQLGEVPTPKNGVNGFLKGLGVKDFITIITMIVGFTVSYMGIQSEILMVRESMLRHIDAGRHYTPIQEYWLNKIELEGGFTWKPEEKGEFVRRVEQHIAEFEKGVKEGRFQHPAEKEREMVRIFKLMFEEMKDQEKAKDN